MRYVAFLISFVMCLAVPISGQEITIHVLDGRNGKPLPNAKVGLSTVHEYQLSPVNVAVKPRGADYVVLLPHEILAFELGYVSLGTRQFRTCTNLRNGDLSEVAKIVQTGIALPDECKMAISVPTKPGEITFFVRPLTAGEIFGNWWAGAFNG